MVEITKISSKGQIVIPSRLREKLGLIGGTRLVADVFNNILVLKRIRIEGLNREFEKLTKEGEKVANANRISSEEDIVRRIHRGRKGKN